MISNVHTETTTENVKSARDSFVEHRKEVHCSRKRWNICLVLDVVGKFFLRFNFTSFSRNSLLHFFNYFLLPASDIKKFLSMASA